MFCCHYHGFSCSQLGEDVTLLLQHHGLKPDINTDIPKVLSKSPKAQGFHWGVAGVAEPLVEGLLDLKDPVVTVMAPFAKKYFWFLSHVMSMLGCSLLSGLNA